MPVVPSLFPPVTEEKWPDHGCFSPLTLLVFNIKGLTAKVVYKKLVLMIAVISLYIVGQLTGSVTDLASLAFTP